MFQVASVGIDVLARSKCTPRYLTSSVCGRYVPLSWTGGHVDLLNVNVVW